MTPRVWKWFNGRYRASCDSVKMRDVMLRWPGTETGSVYTFPDRPKAFDVTIGPEYVQKAMALLGVKKLG